MDAFLGFNDLFIFEMANSHQGSVEHGINIIRACGRIARKYNIMAAVKLQYRNLDTFIHPDFVEKEDVPHVKRFMSTRLGAEGFGRLVEAIREEGMMAMSTPFDEDSVGLCLDQGLDIIKIASCSATDWPLLERAAAANRPLIVSTGGKTLSEIDKIYNFLTHRGATFAFMHCVAEYPAPHEHLQLDFIDRMKKRYPEIPVGYSGHEAPDDNIIAMMAAAKGACFFERHVGLPTDSIKLNAYSMNPEQSDNWVASILEARKICRTGKENDKYVSQAEIDSLNSLMRGTYLKKPVKKGDVLKREDVFFAMPCADGQTGSGQFTDGMVASRDYRDGEPLCEMRPLSNISIMRDVIHDAKGMLYEAGIALGDDFEVELSHHFGMAHFRSFGAIIINMVNREYCKKLIIVLPGQKHPSHLHKQKEETFQLLFGDLEVTLEGHRRTMKPGDKQTVLRGQAHDFTSRGGAIFEEISTTHVRNDSYYEDERIAALDPLERKSILKSW